MEPFLGQIQAFGFGFAPRGWMQCQGNLLAINVNTALFSLLGTTYGGDGRTTFAIPDFRGRTMVGQGQGPGLSAYTLGQAGGTENVTLLTSQMPVHNHSAVAQPHTHTATATATLYAERVPGTVANPNANMLATSANMYTPPDPGNNVTLDAGAVATSVTIAPATDNITIGMAGNSMPVQILSPYLCVNVCIATEGIFPPRN